MPRLPNGLKVASKKKKNAKPSTLTRKLKRQQKAKLNIDPAAKRARRREFRKAKANGTEDQFYRKYARTFTSNVETEPSVRGTNAHEQSRQASRADASEDQPPPKKKLSKKMKRKLRAQQTPKEEEYFSIAQSVQTEDGVVSVQVDDEAFDDTEQAGAMVAAAAGDVESSDEDMHDDESEDEASAVENRYNAANRSKIWDKEEEGSQKLPTKSAATGRMIPGKVIRGKAREGLPGSETGSNSNVVGVSGDNDDSDKPRSESVAVDDFVDSGVDSDSFSDADADSADDDSDSDSDADEAAAILANRQRVQQQAQAKADIAHFSQYILANPTKGLRPPRGARSHMQELHRYSKIDDANIVCWTLLSELAIFIDILPGYRITLIGDHHVAGDKDGDKKRQLLSKEVRELRTFERNLLTAYENFLSVVKRYATQDTQGGKFKLNQAAKKKGQQLPFLFGTGQQPSNVELQAADKIRLVCVQCILKLLLARPTFNHADTLMNIAVALADGTHAGSRALAAATLVKIFVGEDIDDPESQCALKTVKLVGQRIKRRGQRARPELFYCLNRLKLKVDMTEVRQKSKKKNRRNRKRRYKHTDEVERELAEADARIKDQQRHEAHAEMLREVIVVYFRVLKEEDISKHLPIILRGLSRLAHLINIDIVADLVKELRRISQQCAVAAGHSHGGVSGLGRGGAGSGASGIGSNQPAATATATALVGTNLTLSGHDELLLLLTVFTTLEGPGEELKVDCTFFLERLHQLLLDLPMLSIAAEQERRRNAEAKRLELRPGSVLHLMDQESVAANVHGAKRWRGSHPVILVAQCLDMAYLRRQETNAQRSAIVCRRCMQVALQLRPHEGLAMVTAARFIMQKYPKVAQLLRDAPEDGVFAAPGFADDGGAQARPTAWHLLPLQRHFHPQVKAAAADVVRAKPALPRHTAVVLFDKFDCSTGGFNPPPASKPPPGAKGFRSRSLEFARKGVTAFDDILEQLDCA